MLKLPLGHRFFFGYGMVGDDTDHSIFVGQSLAKYPRDPNRFAQSLAWRFRFWFLCMPAGIGMATLRSILRLWLGISPSRSGVFSAGNGAAMRSAIIGVVHCEDPKLRREFTEASSLVTHMDPKAIYGALAVAELAAFIAVHESKPDVSELHSMLACAGEGEEWNEVVRRTVVACDSGRIDSSLTTDGLKNGVSGYIYHTLPPALAAWYINFGDFKKTVESAVELGGDTDTVASIAGSLAGISYKRSKIPNDWVAGIAEYPHSPRYISILAEQIAQEKSDKTAFSWFLLPRGLLFTMIVLSHGVRRLFPPY